jgi:hypothetical protein
MFNQVQVDLDNLDENSLRSLGATQEVRNAEKLSPDGKAVSEFWEAQPPKAGEGQLVAVNGMLFTFCASVIQFHPANSFLATIVAVDNGVLRDPIEVEIPSTAMIHELQDVLNDGLICRRQISLNFVVRRSKTRTIFQIKNRLNSSICRKQMRFISSFGYLVQKVSFID